MRNKSGQFVATVPAEQVKKLQQKQDDARVRLARQEYVKLHPNGVALVRNDDSVPTSS
jgi:hypothetical protein